MEGEPQEKKINRLMAAVVQDQDVERAMRALQNVELVVTRLPSTGGFLGRRSATLLIGFTAGQEELTIKTLQKRCRTRVEYVTIPLEGTPLPIPAPTPITVGGATIFTLEVESYEEF